jgi:Divergent InlB B-repeat domain
MTDRWNSRTSRALLLAVTVGALIAMGPVAGRAAPHPVTRARGTCLQACHTLTVTLTGSGFGRVTSSPGGIDCPTTCASAFVQGTIVTLSETPNSGSAFTGWTGCDGGTTEVRGAPPATCQVTMFADQPASAGFGLTAPTLTKPIFGYERQKAKFAVAWTPVTGTGVKYDLRMRSAPMSTGVFSSYADAKTGLTGTTVNFAGTQGTRYCFEVQAAHGGSRSPVSNERCTSVPLDDRALTRHGTWTAKHLFGYYLNTFLTTKTHGASLTASGVHANELAVVATVCPACGSIRVSMAGASHNFSLVGPATKREQVLIFELGTVQTGTVTILVTSSNKRVEIDGLGSGVPAPA